MAAISSRPRRVAPTAFMLKPYARRALDAKRVAAPSRLSQPRNSRATMYSSEEFRAAGFGARHFDISEMPLERIDDVLELRAHEELHDHRAARFQHRYREAQRAIYQNPRTRLVPRGNPCQFRRKVARHEIGLPAKLAMHPRSDSWIEDVTGDRDRTGWRILHLRQIDSDHASARARRRHQDRQPSAGRASQIHDSRTPAQQPVARNYFFNLERRPRRQSQRTRLAVKFVVRLVSRHKFTRLGARSLCRARWSSYPDWLRAEFLKLRRSP